MSEATVILTTASKEEEALAIARALVGEGLAACVNVVPGVRSIYRWEGKVCDDAELLLVVKTTPAKQDAVIAKIQSVHSYDCPEAIALPVVAGSRKYLDWLTEATQ
jgi:periplasmic divalent cation tolerance protein